MLVSVTGRTKEIGIRMSVGARRRDILKQFLLESVKLSMTGGIIGIILGVVISQYVPHFFPDLSTIISLEAIIISFLFSVGVGIFFGFYPAWQASKLDPIEALRYE
jgi:putative ABC transport system permease protein